MSIELLKMSPAEFLMLTSKFEHLGSTTVLSHDDGQLDNVHDLESTDIVIYYDYVTDDCDKTECDAFHDWLEGNNSTPGLLDMLTSFMSDNGYDLLDEHDGSGNGLIYGTMQYRKA